MLLIIGTVRIPPAGLSHAKADMQAVITASRAEPGCLEYSYGEDVLDPGLIHVKEIWRDRESFRAHGRAAHADAWRQRWRDIGLTDRTLVAHEIGEPEVV